MKTLLPSIPLIQPCLGVNRAGHLTIAGRDAVALAEKYGTPAYYIDLPTVRARCREYKTALGTRGLPLYAGKAMCCAALYRVIAEEGLGADVVSCGEIATAVKAGFPMDKVFFHGNNKTDADIVYALEHGVGCFVVDNFDELDALDRIAGQRGAEKQKILLRVTPGIDPHTHRKIMTGSVDSKFGVAIATGQAERFVRSALTKKNLDLTGLHCHIGSQIFETDPFIDAARIMTSFIADMRDITGWTASELNLGGGFAVRYIAEHPEIDLGANTIAVADAVDKVCAEYGLPVPYLYLEPGRSIIADAGVTLYTVGSVKNITGYKNYVSVDGGMPDNPRYTLYASPYTIINASHATAPAECEYTVAGRCCESGDLLAEGIKLAKSERGDILAVCDTGAYNYSMASNYNRIPRPPVIMLADNADIIAVERESFDDITRLDRI